MTFGDVLHLVTRCECSDPAHIMDFVYLPNGRWPELYVEVQLNPLVPWYRRVWYAVGYIAGTRSRYGYGQWDTGAIDQESAMNLLVLLQRFLADIEAKSAAPPGAAVRGWVEAHRAAGMTTTEGGIWQPSLTSRPPVTDARRQNGG